MTTPTARRMVVANGAPFPVVIDFDPTGLGVDGSITRDETNLVCGVEKEDGTLGH